jgi:ribosomal protein S18 acetylase RimI-like enzyme
MNASAATSVRRAGADDLEALATLFDAYRQFYAQPSDLLRARTFLAERIARDESVLLLAEHAGVAAGFVQLYPIFSSVRTGRIWTLNDLFVAPHARRLGVARTLLRAACEHGRATGALGLQLETTSSNQAAQALYRSEGWHDGDTLWFHRDLIDTKPMERA